MERSVSLAERSTAAAAPANDLRCHSASYAVSYAPTKVQRDRSTTSLSRPVAATAVQRSGSTRTVSGAGAGPTPGLNLRCYSASYKPFSDGTAQAKGPNAATTTAATWSSAGRRSLNLRSYTPSFSALVDNEAPAPAPAKTDDADAELQRKKRLVAYKVYDVEGKVKGSVRRSVKWIKVKCSRAVYGW